ncbi:MAG: hypothetical protein H6579_07880 [Chitinophagales bacterium]|nr:hypothetical protein [Chitinophagales bacterium]
MKNEEFDKLIKGKLQDLEMSPPPKMFQKIQAGLAKEQPKKRALLFLPFMKYASAAAVAFLMGMAVMSVMYKAKETTATNTEQVNTINNAHVNLALEQEEKNLLEEVSEELVSSTVSNAVLSTKNIEKEKSKTSTANSLTLLSSNAAPSSKIVFSSSSKNEAENASLANLSNMKVYALYSLDSKNPDEISMAKIETDAEFNRFNLSKSRTPYAGLWFGAQLSFQSRFIGGQAFLGNGFGLDFGVNFNERIGLQTALHYSMLSKEFKVEQLDGKYSYELLNLSRIYLPLSLKVKQSYFARGIERPVSFNAYFGGDYAYLPSIAKHEAGVHLGMEYDIFLRPEMMISLGLRAGAGHIFNYPGEASYLQNINSQKLNYSLGIYTALRFTSKKD